MGARPAPLEASRRGRPAPSLQPSAVGD